MSAWPIVRLGEVIQHRKGSITIDDATTYKLCRVQLHRRGVVLREHRSGAEIRTKKQQVCRGGDFLVAEMDAKVGGYGFVPPELDGAIVSSHYFLFEVDETRLWPGFLEVVAQAEILQRQIVAKGSTNYAAIRPASVLGWEIPLPPLAVQKRMATNFTRARSALAAAEQEIAHQEDLVAKLKQAILQEAITGRLTAGWRAANPKVEPASQLLARIRAEKARLVAAKKLRPEKPLPPIPDSEIPFALPEGWEWCRLADVYLSTSGGTPARTHASYWSGSVPWLKSGEMNDGYIVDPPEEMITELGLENSSACLFPKGTLLIAMYGATAGKLGILTYPSTTNQAVCGLFTHPLAETRYAFFYLLSQRDKMIQDSWGNSQPNISQGYLRNLPIPLPPLAEQTEIVARVEALMERCRELEAEIARSRAHAEALLQAVLREAFAPAAAPVAASVSRPSIKPLAYLLQFLPALARAAGGTVTLEQLNRAAACLFLPKTELLPLAEKLAGTEAREHFAGLDQAYEDGAFLAALRTLLKAKAFVSEPKPGVASRFSLTDHLPPITPEIDADARYLAPIVDRIPENAVARSAARHEAPRVREVLLSHA